MRSASVCARAALRRVAAAAPSSSIHRAQPARPLHAAALPLLAKPTPIAQHAAATAATKPASASTASAPVANKHPRIQSQRGQQTDGRTGHKDPTTRLPQRDQPPNAVVLTPCSHSCSVFVCSCSWRVVESESGSVCCVDWPDDRCSVRDDDRRVAAGAVDVDIPDSRPHFHVQPVRAAAASALACAAILYDPIQSDLHGTRG